MKCQKFQLLSEQQFCEKKRSDILQPAHRPLVFLDRQSNVKKLRHKFFIKKTLFTDDRNLSDLKHGVSAIIKTHNKESLIYNAIDSIKDCFNEIIVIDNNSSDSTLAEIRRFIEENPSLKCKLKLYHYKFNIAKHGLDNFYESDDSPYTTASFNNYGLKKCTYSRVCM